MFDACNLFTSNLTQYNFDQQSAYLLHSFGNLAFDRFVDLFFFKLLKNIMVSNFLAIFLFFGLKNDV